MHYHADIAKTIVLSPSLLLLTFLQASAEVQKSHVIALPEHSFNSFLFLRRFEHRSRDYPQIAQNKVAMYQKPVLDIDLHIFIWCFGVFWPTVCKNGSGLQCILSSNEKPEEV